MVCMKRNEVKKIILSVSAMAPVPALLYRCSVLYLCLAIYCFVGVVPLMGFQIRYGIVLLDMSYGFVL